VVVDGERVLVVEVRGLPVSDMSRTHLTRLCDEGRIESFPVGNALRVPAEEVCAS